MADTAELLANFYLGNRIGKGNIDLFNRPAVKLPNGQVASVLSKSFNVGGKEVLIPTVRNGLDRPMTDNEALDWYRKTGEHLGIFNTPEEANSYAERLHLAQQNMSRYRGK